MLEDVASRPREAGCGKIVRFVYLDEAGISTEPVTVVAGFMLHVDSQYRDFMVSLNSIAHELFCDGVPQNFVFHAKDLWHGSGFFSRDAWPRDKRLEVLNRLASLPGEFNSPIVYSAVSRDEAPSPYNANSMAWARHKVAFLYAMNEVEKTLSFHYPNERAFLIVEDNPSHRKYLQSAFEFYCNRDGGAHPWAKKIEVPYYQIVETPLFQKKDGASPAQIADLCAFLIRRRLSGCKIATEITEQFTPSLVSGWKTQFSRLF